MVTPPQLIKAVSTMTGISLATVTDLDRWLVKGDLRPVGGRGLNAARMGPQDAARLLTAVLASPQSNEAAKTVLRYAQTRSDKTRSTKGLFESIGLDELTGLPARHSFIDGLAALIGSATSGSFAKLLSTTSSKPGPKIEVVALTSGTFGRIRISDQPNKPIASVEYVLSTEPGVAGKGRAPHSGRLEKPTVGDLRESRRISERTIFGIGRLLATG